MGWEKLTIQTVNTERPGPYLGLLGSTPQVNAGKVARTIQWFIGVDHTASDYRVVLHSAIDNMGFSAIELLIFFIYQKFGGRKVEIFSLHSNNFLLFHEMFW